MEWNGTEWHVTCADSYQSITEAFVMMEADVVVVAVVSVLIDSCFVVVSCWDESTDTVAEPNEDSYRPVTAA